MGTTMLASDAALEQRYRALDRANEVRSRRCELKAQLLDGSRRIEDVVREPEWWLFSAPVHELLSWARHVRIADVLRDTGVWPLATMGRLLPVERDAIVRRLRGLPFERPEAIEPSESVDSPPARTLSGWAPEARCRSCGEHMSHRTDEGLCGFCIAERAEAA